MAKIPMRDLPLDDLKVKLRDMSEEIFKLKFRLTTQPLDNPLRIRTVRKDIARLKTFIRQHELGISSLSAGAEARAATPVRTRAAAPKPKKAAKAAAKAPKKAAAKKKSSAKKSPARKRSGT
jgi:large subunit ribosomal protein L29